MPPLRTPTGTRRRVLRAHRRRLPPRSGRRRAAVADRAPGAGARPRRGRARRAVPGAGRRRAVRHDGRGPAAAARLRRAAAGTSSWASARGTPTRRPAPGSRSHLPACTRPRASGTRSTRTWAPRSPVAAPGTRCIRRGRRAELGRRAHPDRRRDPRRVRAPRFGEFPAVTRLPRSRAHHGRRHACLDPRWPATSCAGRCRADRRRLAATGRCPSPWHREPFPTGAARGSSSTGDGRRRRSRSRHRHRPRDRRPLQTGTDVPLTAWATRTFVVE